MNRKFLMISGIVVLLGITAYLDSPFSIINRDYSYTASRPASTQPIDDSIPNPPSIKDKLVKKEHINGYIVEIFREYEVYKDKDGNVIKSVPTSQTDMLKYWDYQNDKMAAK